MILLVVGTVCLISGLDMDTTTDVPGQVGRVHNTGRLNDRLVRVVTGVGLIVFSGVLKVVAVLEESVRLQRQLQADGGTSQR
ncbi:hypothetical protein [Urbifossiella limnaea]|uniref:Uncharacterized protein n=1 Tax=Urbifossiella limnaea TaxID=2528023 RepID=A0A517Y0M7_9BACT|nr:hypothetical protein [Urbifossiella limnaea]QDU23307.1 hypothetical protein ETAA1_53020 [Urbifossiella limnaea]